MSAVLKAVPQWRPLTETDLPAVMAIENSIYPFPWTLGNFRDSLAAGYGCHACTLGGELIGYAVVMAAADEAHLLNLSVAAAWQRRGLGREMLAFVLKLARDFCARKIHLEVRPSNLAAQRLYAGAGFSKIATRRGYYPGQRGREDAVIMELELT
jgi:ribosomal-protein-alanine N-acetyltransferase